MFIKKISFSKIKNFLINNYFNVLIYIFFFFLILFIFLIHQLSELLYNNIFIIINYKNIEFINNFFIYNYIDLLEKKNNCNSIINLIYYWIFTIYNFKSNCIYLYTLKYEYYLGEFDFLWVELGEFFDLYRPKAIKLLLRYQTKSVYWYCYISRISLHIFYEHLCFIDSMGEYNYLTFLIKYIIICYYWNFFFNYNKKKISLQNKNSYFLKHAKFIKVNEKKT